MCTLAKPFPRDYPLNEYKEKLAEYQRCVDADTNIIIKNTSNPPIVKTPYKNNQKAITQPPVIINKSKKPSAPAVQKDKSEIKKVAPPVVPPVTDNKIIAPKTTPAADTTSQTPVVVNPATVSDSISHTFSVDTLNKAERKVNVEYKVSLPDDEKVPGPDIKEKTNNNSFRLYRFIGIFCLATAAVTLAVLKIPRLNNLFKKLYYDNSRIGKDIKLYIDENDKVKKLFSIPDNDDQIRFKKLYEKTAEKVDLDKSHSLKEAEYNSKYQTFRSALSEPLEKIKLYSESYQLDQSKLKVIQDGFIKSYLDSKISYFTRARYKNSDFDKDLDFALHELDHNIPVFRDKKYKLKPTGELLYSHYSAQIFTNALYYRGVIRDAYKFALGLFITSLPLFYFDSKDD